MLGGVVFLRGYGIAAWQSTWGRGGTWLYSQRLSTTPYLSTLHRAARRTGHGRRRRGRVSCLDLEHCPPTKKTIASTRSFGRPVETLDELKEAVATFTSRAAQKLRRQHGAAGLLTVFVNTNRFKPEEPQYRRSASKSLLIPTDDMAELLYLAMKLTTSIYRNGYRYKQAGVMLDGIVRASQVPPTLFDRTDRVRRSRLMNVMDRINAEMGTGTLRSAATGPHRLPVQRQPHWHTRCGHRSWRYTTKWDELPRVIV